MATIGDIGLAEPSTLTARLAAVQVTRNSTVQSQEILCIGDPDSTTSSAIAKVTNAALASTAWGLGVRSRSMPESTLWADSAGFHFNSSGALNVDITGGASTLVTARLQTSSGGGVEGSTGNPVTDALGLHVRPVRPQLLTAASTAGSDTLAVMVAGSTTAGTGRIFVSAFTIASTVQGPVNAGFYSMAGGGSTLIWPVTVWAGGGFMNHPAAVAAPGYLFATSTGSTLTFQVASTGAYRVAVTYSTGV